MYLYVIYVGDRFHSVWPTARSAAKALPYGGRIEVTRMES